MSYISKTLTFQEILDLLLKETGITRPPEEETEVPMNYLIVFQQAQVLAEVLVASPMDHLRAGKGTLSNILRTPAHLINNTKATYKEDSTVDLVFTLEIQPRNKIFSPSTILTREEESRLLETATSLLQHKLLKEENPPCELMELNKRLEKHFKRLNKNSKAPIPEWEISCIDIPQRLQRRSADPEVIILEQPPIPSLKIDLCLTVAIPDVTEALWVSGIPDYKQCREFADLEGVTTLASRMGPTLLEEYSLLTQLHKYFNDTQAS